MISRNNLDRSAFRRGEWVGYCAGTVYRIAKRPEGWRAYPTVGDGTPFTCLTLTAVSDRLRAYAGGR